MSDAHEESAAHAHDPAAAEAHHPEPLPPEPPVLVQPPRQPERSHTPWIAAAVAIVAALLIAGSAPLWTPFLPWSGGTAALEARIDQAEAARRAADARVARLEQQLQQLDASVRSAAPAAAIAALNDRVGSIERRPDTSAQTAQDLARLQQAMGGLSIRLDGIEARMGKLAAAQSAEGGTDRMLFLAVTALRAAIAGSGPYQAELAAVQALDRDDATLAPVAASAQSGLPSTALLADRFSRETAPAIFRAAAAGPSADESWAQQILARLRTLVIVHRVDGGGDPTEAAVAQAQRALGAGDLAGAVSAVKSLSGAPAAATASWLALAERRLAAEAALTKLAQQAAQRIAGEAR